VPETVGEWHVVPVTIVPVFTVCGACLSFLQRQGVDGQSGMSSLGNLLAQLLIGRPLDDVEWIVCRVVHVLLIDGMSLDKGGVCGGYVLHRVIHSLKVDGAFTHDT
jgi:hypothetical protein